MKVFALLGLLLFLGLAVAPSINADFKVNLKSNVNSPLFNKRIRNAIEEDYKESLYTEFIGENSDITIPISSNAEDSKYFKYISKLTEELNIEPDLISDLINKLESSSLLKLDSDIFEPLSKMNEEQKKFYSKDYSCGVTVGYGCFGLLFIGLILLFLFIALFPLSLIIYVSYYVSVGLFIIIYEWWTNRPHFNIQNFENIINHNLTNNLIKKSINK